MLPWQHAITSAGGCLYEVGGCVRDRFLGRAGKDRDYLVTGLPLEHLGAVLKAFGAVAWVGKAFGVLKFSPHQSPETVHDIALPRTETSTGVGHRDFAVTFDHALPVETDLGRRDFTINAMAWDLTADRCIDPFNGRADLERRLIRQVFPAAFEEDPLRLLRAIQFAARFDLTIEPETAAAMRRHAALLGTVSGERIVEEIRKLLLAKRPSVGFYRMAELDILPHCFPELAACIGVAQDKMKDDDVFGHTMRVLDAARADPELLAPGDLHLLFAALYHDVGKPKTRRFDPAVGRITFYGHQLVSKRICAKRLHDLKAATIGLDALRVCRLVELHMFETKAHFTDKAIRRFIQKVGPDLILTLLDLRLADNRGGKYPGGIKGALRLRKRIREELDRKPPFGPKDLAINGHDLIAMGIAAGPKMGQVLHQLVELCLDDPAMNERERLLALARGMHEGL
ncbi:MAG: CCA tRNA nucleotidyltransferase [Deltaproteobacteria bacterium]|nr:CCA tRNA nucleotidyltransferase [Deltaproteobacteria bacterium]